MVIISHNHLVRAQQPFVKRYVSRKGDYEIFMKIGKGEGLTLPEAIHLWVFTKAEAERV